MQPSVRAFTELRASDGTLTADSEFELTVPLPRWWPLPPKSSDIGSSIIRKLVDRDTRESIKRINAEYLKWKQRDRGG